MSGAHGSRPQMTPPLFAELEAWLGKHFPESDLARAASPIVHDVHIRFELGEPFANGTDQRLTQVVHRAASILEGCFRPADRLLLLINDWETPDPMFGNTTPEHLYDLLGTRQLASAERRRLPLPLEDDESPPAYFQQVLLPASLEHIPWREILVGIANYEQGREPGIGQAVHFIAPEPGIVFHMYDDRGCLVFAERPSSIVHLYRAYNEWIVDYWRETIDAVFATVP